MSSRVRDRCWWLACTPLEGCGAVFVRATVVKEPWWVGVRPLGVVSADRARWWFGLRAVTATASKNDVPSFGTSDTLSPTRLADFGPKINMGATCRPHQESRVGEAGRVSSADLPRKTGRDVRGSVNTRDGVLGAALAAKKRWAEFGAKRPDRIPAAGGQSAQNVDPRIV